MVYGHRVNAYLEATTKEKRVIIAGIEFGELEGHMLVIKKALYGLRTSGQRWHERFAACLKELGYSLSPAEPNNWMGPSKDKSHYEYIAVYVDDLAIVMQNPKEFIDLPEKKYGIKLKGTGPVS